MDIRDLVTNEKKSLDLKKLNSTIKQAGNKRTRSKKASVHAGLIGLAILPLSACGDGGKSPSNSTPPAPPPPPTPDFTEDPANTFTAKDDNDRTLDQGAATANLTVIGKAGNDTITTGSGADIIAGGQGNDVITSGAGADMIRGGEGADTIMSGDGDDVIVVVGTTTAGQYTDANITNPAGSGVDLSSLVTLADLNGRTVSEIVAGETIDGGAGNDTLFIYGTVDLTGVTLTNVNKMFVNSDVTLTPEQIAQFTTIDGDGNSVINIIVPEGAGEVILDLSTLEISDIGALNIQGDIRLVISSLDDLAGITSISGNGTLTVVLADTANVALSDLSAYFTGMINIEVQDGATLAFTNAADLVALGVNSLGGTGNISMTNPDGLLPPLSATVPFEGLSSIENLQADYQWGTPGEPLVITYSFPQSSSDYDTAIDWAGGTTTTEELLTGFAAFGDDAQSAVQSMLDLWAGYANITFIELTGDLASEATLRFASSNADFGQSSGGFSGDIQGFAFAPGDTLQAGTIWLDSEYLSSMEPGGEGWGIFQHELGHALTGFNHPKIDSLVPVGEYTVMGYTTGGNSGPMLMDVALLQHLYGANTSMAAGDTIYDIQNLAQDITGLDSAAETTWYQPSTQFTLWDSGGEDTIDFSGVFTSDLHIDLNPGTRSGVYAQGNGLNNIIGNAIVSISDDTAIENVVGTYVSDNIIGNPLDNHMAGGGGSDVISGGGGTDTVHYAGVQSDYTIVKIQDGYEIRSNADTTLVDYVHGDVEFIAFGGDSAADVHSQSDASQNAILLSDAADATASNAGTPIAGADHFIVPESGNFTLSLLDILANDQNPGASGLEVTAVTTETPGVTLDIIGNELYVTLAEGLSGEITLTYNLQAGNQETTTGNITLFTTNVGDVVVENPFDSGFAFGFESHNAVGQSSMDGSLLLQTSQFGVTLWNTAEETLIVLPSPADFGDSEGIFQFGSLSQNGQYAVLHNPDGPAVLFNVETGTTTLLDFTIARADSETVFITDDGQTIYFGDYAPNVNFGDTFLPISTYQYDVATSATTVLLSEETNQGRWVGVGDISADGQYIIIDTFDDLIGGGSNFYSTSYVWDTVADTYTALLYLDENNVVQSVIASDAQITNDGTTVVFMTTQGILDSDTNGQFDIYTFDVPSGEYTLISQNGSGVAGNNASRKPHISVDGQYITYITHASDISGLPLQAIMTVNLLSGEQAVVHTYSDITDPSIQTGPIHSETQYINPEFIFVSGDGTEIFYYDNGYHDVRLFNEGGERVITSVTNPLTLDNSRPVALSDVVSLNDGVTLISAETLLNNDFDLNGDDLQIVSVANAIGGTVSLVNGDVSFEMTDSSLTYYNFTYIISDGAGGYAETIVTFDRDGNGTSAVQPEVSRTFLTSNNTEYTGTSASDNVMGSRMADIIDGQGGADILVSGDGNDTIIISNLDFININAGEGTDTLVLDGSGLDLDLTTQTYDISGIEEIDLTGSGDNSLTLSADDLLGLSETTNQLIVLGDAGDAVTSTGQSWVLGSDQTLEGEVYHTYTSGDATLLVDVDITQNMT